LYPRNSSRRDCNRINNAWFISPDDGLKLLAQFDDAVSRTDAAPENVRVEHCVAPNDRAGIQHAVAADVAAVANDRPELAQACVNVVAILDRDIAFSSIWHRQNHTRAKVALKPEWNHRHN